MICLEACCTCFRSPWLHSVFQVIYKTVYIPRVRRCWDPGIWGPESLFSLSQRSPVGSSWRECSSGTWGKPSIGNWAHWLWWELWEVSGSRSMTSSSFFFFLSSSVFKPLHSGYMGGSKMDNYTLDLWFSNFSMPNKNYFGSLLKFRVRDSVLKNSGVS